MSIFTTLFSLKHKFEKSFKTLNNIYISRENILNNFDIFQNLHPSWDVFPVLKSNAYGHGIREVATILKERKIKYIAVDSYFEALKIWEVSNIKILLIGYSLTENLSKMNFKKTSLVVYDLGTLEELVRIWKPVNIHIKLDTGMHRQWIYIDDLPIFLEYIKNYKNINLEWIATHFADADSLNNSYSIIQENLFKQWVEIIKNAGFNLKYIHSDNSAASVKWFWKNTCNSLRLGISLYWINPLEPDDKYFNKLANLKLALSFYSTLILKKEIKKGEKVSYNCTFEAQKDMTIWIIPVGYYEWLSRKLSSNGQFYFKNSSLPILGRVCMNLTIADITWVDVKAGDRIEIISDNLSKDNNIYKMAERSETIPYECFTRLSETIRREII
ncbi:MAG: hypothetical protein ACD_49C00038G0008 [uncultured bacterium (gcode 4)]|uniref:Alanine racemase C-terminal domain-containing protein n=1 Tax=uncultured bacterium (gcode 4) TaxID=1234023 RepID=K2BW36_9BACT|nr:MAG: hypothetical protein ACD_49C00038G0008 [uncultured bacterium (gcode 4)]